MPAATGSSLHWWGTLLYVPVLYGLGWLIARPLALLFPLWRPDQVDLAGVVVSLLLLLLTLPWRLRRAWGVAQPWQCLGVTSSPSAGLRAFGGGLLKATALLLGVVVVLLVSGQSQWQGQLTGGQALNAIALLLGVGFAEELLFRGWLWGELELQGGPQRAMVLQAVCFALVHPWYQLPPLEAITLLPGLVLLGLALGLQRRADAGVLWGCIGLHGGLVGGWFALQSGLISIPAANPVWLLNTANPIGGLVGWIGLGSVLALLRQTVKGRQQADQRTAVAKAARPDTGARSAS